MTPQKIKTKCERIWSARGVESPCNRNIWKHGRQDNVVSEKGNPVHTSAERQARSRANRAAEGGKAFTVFLGPAEVRALEKIKAKLGTDDASAIIRDALLATAWSL